ncbi:MAG: hypothetical protein P4L45_01935 [Ignavibacteriaceae bacterium]|nr:hypothetical protein [Ignavibacteriaceae bacterium]
MKNILLSSFLLGMFFLFTGCASTSITSFTDPDYRAVQFKNILTVANTNKLSDRLSLENRIVEVMATNGIKAIPSYSIFPPTREFTDNQKKDLMLDNKIDGCLIINFGEQGVQEISIPITGSTSQTKITGNSITTSTQYIGGQTFNKPYAEFELKLYDVSNGKMAWTANSFTGGNAYANFNTVYSSFCNRIVDRLSQDNLIRTINDNERIKKEEVTKRDSNIKRILKEREEKTEGNKIDVIVKSNGDIISGTILSLSYIHDAYYVKIQEIDSSFSRIKLDDIKEVYQK